MPKTLKTIAITLGYAVLGVSIFLQISSLLNLDLGSYLVDLQDTSLRSVLLALSILCFFASFWGGLAPPILTFLGACLGLGVFVYDPPNAMSAVVSLGFFWACLVTTYRQEIHCTEFGSGLHLTAIVCVVALIGLSIFRLELVYAYLSTGFGLVFSQMALTFAITSLGALFTLSIYKGWFLLSALFILPFCLLIAGTFQLSPLYLCYVFGLSMAALCFVASRKGVKKLASEGI